MCKEKWKMKSENFFNGGRGRKKVQNRLPGPGTGYQKFGR